MHYPEAFFVNWSSAYDIHKSLQSFSDDQQCLFETLKTKQEYYGRRFEKGNYFDNAHILVAANSKYAARVTYCGYKNKWNGTGSCQKWRLCSRCAFIRKQRALKTYLSSFRSNRFLFATISFKGELTPKDWIGLTWTVPYWNVGKASIYNEYREERILGAYFTEELKLNGFCPLRVIPHLHSICHMDSNDQEAANSLSTNLFNGVLQAMEKLPCQLALSPSVRVQEIATETDFADILQYETKEIEIKEPYQQALEMGAPVEEINREFSWFLPAWQSTMYRRMGICRVGSMHHQSKQFVGNKWSKSRQIDFVKGYFDERKRLKETKGWRQSAAKVKRE